ncbi:LOW QUALITY PROTEIN: uncharacterized protein LOC128937517 [Melozone crissalis]|uniref:LOW QUALITY PROTEIN: uncharacterized protein LOC128937517 n=1 Tax=Melozone crissalis TaxID=40204 RepID=UPI0023DB5FD0|nr:LOW QUALITY PROTEIN: uncharacterized protein LOC128937517 [Melozone crissalis]
MDNRSQPGPIRMRHGPRVHVALGTLSWLCPHPTHCLEMQTDQKAPVLTFMGLLCSFQSCFICCKMGATITCCQTACDRTFHLPCAPDGQCVTQYFGAYRSFCWEHRPQQALRPRPSQDNTCTICLDTVEDNISYITMACPACQDARFHRHCIQRLALHAGIDFRCPRCLKQEPFMTEMLTMGIRLSKRPPSWQSDPDVGPSDQRHGRCDATMCLCPGGREHSQAHGPWQLRLCSSCAAEGIHRLCSSLGNSTCSWECSTCAATDTGRQQSFQHYAIHTGTTMGLAPGPSAQLGSWKGRDTTAASPACSLGTVLTTFLLPAPLCRFHWQIRPCGPQNLKHRTADSVPGHGAPQEQLLHQPSAGLQAGPRVHVALGTLSWLCPHPTHCLEMQTDQKAPVLTFMGLLCSFQSCFICCKMGATITCCQTACDRTFHLPCAPDGQCVTQYFGAYRSFCWEHRPQQALRPRPSQDNTCTICLDTVEDNISYITMACPACQDARFHRHCIQRLALHAGIDFRCPRCLKQEPFMTEMLTMGIRLSKRPPSWQSDPDVGPSDQRHGRCDATMCLCPGGREHSQAHGPWQLRLCSSCAAEGIHRLCSSLGNSTCSWECSTCAATDTGRQQSFQHYAIHTGTTMGLAPGPSAQLGSWKGRDTTAASPACSLGTVLTTFLLPAPLCRFHWQIRPCGPQNLKHRTADSVPGHGAPQEQLLHQPSAGLQAALRPRPSQDNTCTICLDTVEDNISYITMACPACQDARFHRHCIQRLALHAGIDFRCPRCLKQEPFMTEMLTMGIRLSKRPPSWQSDPEVGPSDQRHGRCDATRCLCPGGREHSQAHGLGRQQSGGEMPAGQRKRRSGRLPTNSPRSKRARPETVPKEKDPHHGRVTQTSDPQIRGTAAAMPQGAFVQEAGSTRRHTGAPTITQPCPLLQALYPLLDLYLDPAYTFPFINPLPSRFGPPAHP